MPTVLRFIEPCLPSPAVIEVRKATLVSILRKARHGIRFNEHLEHDCGLTVFQHACKMGLEGIVSKRLGSIRVTDQADHLTG
jgi:bifunctional non-homologous end joining protein LigD